MDDLEAEEIEVFRTCCKKRRGGGDSVRVETGTKKERQASKVID